MQGGRRDAKAADAALAATPALLLLLLTVVTLAYWLAELFHFRPQREKAAALLESQDVARRADLAGRAPAWIGVGTLDLFFDEDLAYARRLEAAGVPVEVHEVPGAFHGFQKFAPKASISRAFFDSQCAALRRVTEPAG